MRLNFWEKKMNLLKLHVDHGSKESRDERVPGTETLLDQADESQRILVPQPSDDPRDPLVSLYERTAKWTIIENFTTNTRLTKSCIELEHVLESNDDRVRNLHVFRAGIWTTGHCANVS